jgi:hypothetical protein
MKTFLCVITIAFFMSFNFSCNKQQNQKQEKNFEDLMGKGLTCWQYVQTKEDWENLQFFKDIFIKASSSAGYEKAIEKETRIPRVIHFIWLGPKEFPPHSVQNIKSWIAKHPDWTVKFWTDRKRPLPHPSMKMQYVQDFPFLQLKSLFYDSNNYGEKSDVLRYEILLQEGGIYVDHDVQCLRSFEDMNQKYDFFCGLETPSETFLSSSVHVTNNLIASKPGHPILRHGMNWLCEHWKEIEDQYPGNDKESVINRIAHRTFASFSESVRLLAGKESRDIVFPAFYFNAPDLSNAIYARHEYAGTWFENETPFEKMARERLMLLSKKANKILLACGILTALNCIGFVFLFFFLQRAKKRQHHA